MPAELVRAMLTLSENKTIPDLVNQELPFLGNNQFLSNERSIIHHDTKYRIFATGISER